jgi:uncharacterized membrane protein
MRTKVCVVIAIVLALGSTSAVLAQGNGDGGPFDAGDFRGSGFGGGGRQGGDFNRGGYQGGGFQGDGFGFRGNITRDRGYGRGNGFGFYDRHHCYSSCVVLYLHERGRASAPSGIARIRATTRVS